MFRAILCSIRVIIVYGNVNFELIGCSISIFLYLCQIMCRYPVNIKMDI